MPSLRRLCPAALAALLPPLGPLLLLLPSPARAIAFTSPASSDAVARGGEVTARWTTVDADPRAFSLYAWNFASWPPYYEGLAYGVDAAAGEATVRLPCRLAAGGGWQLTAINDTNVYVLYAQTEAFSVTGGGDDDCVDPPASATCYAPTSTVYVTQTAGEFLSFVLFLGGYCCGSDPISSCGTYETDLEFFLIFFFSKRQRTCYDGHHHRRLV